MTTQFFMPMDPPTVTHQEKKVHVVNGKPVFFEPMELKTARGKIRGALSKYKPVEPYMAAVELTVKWCFPIKGNHLSGEYRTSKPDTDNLQKLLKDCMTAIGFWKDDALVCREVTEKFWSDVPGIFIRIEELANG